MEAKTKKKIGWLSIIATIGVAAQAALPAITVISPPAAAGILLGTTIVGMVTGELHKRAEVSDPKGLTPAETAHEEKVEAAKVVDANKT